MSRPATGQRAGSPHFPPQDLTAPRQKARYSDTGFQLLIAIVEAATGRTFADLLHERIFGPLGMDHSWLPGRSKPLGDTAEPAMIHRGRHPLDLPQVVESSNDLISTADDLLRFQAALVSGELLNQPATVHRLTERANLLRNMPPNRYGIGTWIFPVNRLVRPAASRSLSSATPASPAPGCSPVRSSTSTSSDRSTRPKASACPSGSCCTCCAPGTNSPLK